jgi:RNA-directed DNA polymerase
MANDSSSEKLYDLVCSFDNLMLAFKNAKKGKNRRRYVKRFKRNLKENLLSLREELINKTYTPCPLKTFILRDPKTRTISKSAFKDRVVHHGLCNIITPILEKAFIYDSHANQIGKGTLKALERFDVFKRKVSKNETRACYVLKADIRHYFEEIDHEVLLKIIAKKINDQDILWLIKIILSNQSKGTNGMPLGNLTSQFFANVYLNELDQYVKHKLRAKYYIRYVDDFVILHEDKEQLEKWKELIQSFLKDKLHIGLHPSKSHVLNLENGINFLGFRVFYDHKLLRKSNQKNFERKFNHLKILFDEGVLPREKIVECLEGWLNYASHGDTFKYRKYIVREFNKAFPVRKDEPIRNKKKHWNFMKKVKESELKYAVQKTLFWHKKGLSVKDIAIKQNIKESTVWSHFVNLIEYKQIAVWNLLSREKILKILKKVYSRKDRLRDIKKRLNDPTINYDEIDCVMASVRAKKKRYYPKKEVS